MKRVITYSSDNIERTQESSHEEQGRKLAMEEKLTMSNYEEKNFLTLTINE